MYKINDTASHELVSFIGELLQKIGIPGFSEGILQVRENGTAGDGISHI